MNWRHHLFTAHVVAMILLGVVMRWGSWIPWVRAAHLWLGVGLVAHLVYLLLQEPIRDLLWTHRSWLERVSSGGLIFVLVTWGLTGLLLSYSVWRHHPMTWDLLQAHRFLLWMVPAWIGLHLVLLIQYPRWKNSPNKSV